MTEPEAVNTTQPDATATPADTAATTNDTPATTEPSEAERMEAVFEKVAAADAPDPDADESEPETPAAPAEADQKPEQPALELTPPETPPEEMTDEQRDEADAKALGFKNQRANAEFKRMRAAERQAAPLLKDYEERAKPMADRWEHLMNYCERAHIPPDVFGNGMAMIAGIVSNDLDVMRKTRDGLQYELKKLNEKLGDSEDAPTRHQDLQTALENGEITPELARRIAAERAELAHHHTLRQTQTQEQERKAAHAAQTQRAIEEIDRIQQEYEPIDPHFRAKADALIPILKPIFAKLPPSEWAAAFREAYRAAPTPTTTAATRPAPLRNQPLRSTSAPVGSVAAIAKTPEEIMDAAIRRANAKAGVA